MRAAQQQTRKQTALWHQRWQDHLTHNRKLHSKAQNNCVHGSRSHNTMVHAFAAPRSVHYTVAFVLFIAMLY